jgi:hypothetical protein
MTDLRTSLERMRDGFTPPDDAYDRLVTRRARRRRGQRLGTAFVALAVAAAGIGFAARAFLGQAPRTGPSQLAPVQYPEGWTELPLPPRSGGEHPGAPVQIGFEALVWTGSEVIAWGGCDPGVQDECVPTDTGYAFDPATEDWSAIPAAPAAAGAPHAVWTGSEAIFIDEDTFDGVAFDSEARTWRTLPDAPIAPRFGAIYLWTGSEVIVWGGGYRGDPTIAEGAAYDPVADSWRRIADGPVGLNYANAVWTGREMLVFGSAQNDKGWAATDRAVGAAYDPSLDRWRELPSSDLSPQASSAAWTGEVMVAWDYEVHSQEYDPATDSWTPPQKMPLEFDECYPNSVPLQGRVFAFFCGRAALYQPATSEWSEIGGGPLDEELYSEAYERRIKLWRFATLVPTGDVVFLMMEGLTLNQDGTACYGCSGSPHSFWVYNPPTAGS